jgi:hypothetical protein
MVVIVLGRAQVGGIVRGLYPVIYWFYLVFCGFVMQECDEIDFVIVKAGNK